MEVHVKDIRLECGWGFFEFQGPEVRNRGLRTAMHVTKAIPPCVLLLFSSIRRCLGLAKVKGTLSRPYQKEIGGASK